MKLLRIFFTILYSFINVIKKPAGLEIYFSVEGNIPAKRDLRKEKFSYFSFKDFRKLLLSREA